MHEESDRSTGAAGTALGRPANGFVAWFRQHGRGTGLAVAGVAVTGVVVTAVAAVGVSASPVVVQNTAQQSSTTGSPPDSTQADAGLDFDPVVVEGSGSATVPIEVPRPADDAAPEPAYGQVLVTLTHDGSSNLAVWALDAGSDGRTLLINTIGEYEGTRPLPLDTAELSIEADGAWTATISPVSRAAAFSDAATGRGDAAATYQGEASTHTVQHDGEGPFTVVAYRPDGTSDLLVNDLGPFEGTIALEPGWLLVITADGEWRIAGR